MLQTPSKYHPNPLSHFLALHNSTASSHHHHHHQLQAHNHHHHHNHHQGQNQHGTNLNGGVAATTLDVGKSFTIAAILGLQKNAIENSQKDYNSVMNLSMNGHHNHQKSCTSNNIDCDSINTNDISRYFPGNGINPNQIRHHFGSAIGNTGTGSTSTGGGGGGTSALQSLQQLHQHHAQQQASLGFQVREKVKNDHLSSKKSSMKTKRVRTIFTPEQLERLEAEFERQQYMVGPERLYLAHTLQLTEAQVKVWFQNRRIKWRKHHLEITQQRLALIRQTQLPSSENNSNSNNNNNNKNNNASNLTIEHINNQLRQSESDLSVCNDSVDDESFTEPEEV